MRWDAGLSLIRLAGALLATASETWAIVGWPHARALIMAWIVFSMAALFIFTDLHGAAFGYYDEPTGCPT